MIELLRPVVFFASAVCLLVSDASTSGAEPYRLMPLTFWASQPASAQPVKVANEGERGRRGQVQTDKGAPLAEVEDFLLETQKGCIAYGVLKDSKQGTHEGFVVLPWVLLQLNPNDPTMSSFRLREKRELLSSAPHISRVRWTTSAVADWLGVVAQHWAEKGLQPCDTATMEQGQVIKASDVIGMDIQTDSGSNLGTIRELIMDGERGVVVSVIVVGKEPASPLKRTFFTLPWSKLHLNTSHHTITVHRGAQIDL